MAQPATSAHYNATVTHVATFAPDLFAIRVRPDGGVPPYKPGQYATLGLLASAPRLEGCPPGPEADDSDGLIKRAYSVASAPHEAELEVYIALVRTGDLTPQLAMLREGDRLFCAPRLKGVFTLDDVPETASLIFVATGTGLAPFVSMLRDLAHRHGGDGLVPREVLLVHGVRHRVDLGYRDELEGYVAANPRWHYLPAVTRDPEFLGVTGRLPLLFADGTVERALGRTFDVAHDHVYLCGNPDMITAVVALLESRGFREHSKRNPGNVHLEKYW